MANSASGKTLVLPAYLGAKDIQSLGFPRSLVYSMLRRADFPTLIIGGRKFVQRESFFSWLDEQRSGAKCVDERT